MEKENELPGSYAQQDLFYIIYRNLGINAYVCTQGYSLVHFLFSIPFMNIHFILLKARQLPQIARLNAKCHLTSALFNCLTDSEC